MESFVKSQNTANKKKGKLRQFRDKPVAINITMGEKDAALYKSLSSTANKRPKEDGYSDSGIQIINTGNQPRMSKAAVLDLISSKLQVIMKCTLNFI